MRFYTWDTILYRVYTSGDGMYPEIWNANLQAWQPNRTILPMIYNGDPAIDQVSKAAAERIAPGSTASNAEVIYDAVE